MKYLMLAISIVLYTGLFAVVNGKDAAGLPAIVLKEESNPKKKKKKKMTAIVLKEESNPGFRYEGGDLSESERAGGESLVQGHGGNERFFTWTSLHQESLRLKLHDLPAADGEANGRVQGVGKDQ